MGRIESKSVKLNKIKIIDNCVHIKVTLSDDVARLVLRNEDKAYLALRFRSKLKEESYEIWPREEMVKTSVKGVVSLQVIFDFKSEEGLKPIFWDLFFCIVRDEVTYEVPVDCGNFNKKVRNPFYMKCCYWKETNMFLYPYIKDSYICFQYRLKTKSDTTAFRLKELLMILIYKLFGWYWKRKNILLVYEKYCNMAQENGYYFFKYCMDNNVEEYLNKKIYFVIDKQSSDIERLSAYEKNVLSFMSFKHIMYAICAKLLVSSDSKNHLYIWRRRHSIISGMIKKKPLVFLQHGVIALKDVRSSYAKGQLGECEIFIVSSEQEKDIITSKYGYSDNEVEVTGLTRWDVIKDNSVGKKQILVMTTWRNWLDEVTPHAFLNSEYYQKYLELINSKKLEKILVEADANVKFYVHTKFKKYTKEFTSNNSRVEVITFGEIPLNKLMMESNMMITDYSSTGWDMFYMRKPVIFYQFDMRRYLEGQGSHIDMEKDLFGERVDEIDDLLPIIEDYIEKDFVLKDKYAKMHTTAFEYVDHDNSKRIVEMIKRKF